MVVTIQVSVNLSILATEIKILEKVEETTWPGITFPKCYKKLPRLTALSMNNFYVEDNRTFGK